MACLILRRDFSGLESRARLGFIWVASWTWRKTAYAHEAYMGFWERLQAQPAVIRMQHDEAASQARRGRRFEFCNNCVCRETMAWVV